MAYMSSNNGNLMVIAQQVIHQQQQHCQQQPHQLGSSVNPIAAYNLPWASQCLHHQHVAGHFPFVVPDSAAASFGDSFGDSFAVDAISGLETCGVGRHLDHGLFPLSDFESSVAAEFDSDEWVESLIGESPAEDSVPVSDPWLVAADSMDALFADDFPSCTAEISLPSSPADVHRFFFSGPSEIAHHVPVQSRNEASLLQPYEDSGDDDDVATAGDVQDQLLQNKTSLPLLECLNDCARLADSNPDLAAESLIGVRESAAEFGHPTERVAFYFAEALHQRLLGAQRKHPSPLSAFFDSSPEDFALCYKALDDACPYSKFAHFTANQAILEATQSAPRIHIVDFGISQGVQWAPLLQALATRPSGKPSKVRISGIPALALGAAPAASLAATGNRLRNFALLLGLDFEFIPILTPITELDASNFLVGPDESVAVNFMLQLHHLLGDSPEPAERALRAAKSLAPRVVTVCEYEAAKPNRAGFAERFGTALAYYATVFDSLDAAMGRDSAERARAERLVLGRRILAAVGPGVGERMGAKEEWAAVMERCGLEPVAWSNYAVSQAKLLLWNYDYSSKYALSDSPPAFLSLGWGDRPLLTVSSWC